MIHLLASATSLTWYWLWHPLQGPGYQFWSGIGSDIGQVTLITGLAAAYWQHSCHVGRCWRPGRHPVDGTPYKACRKHHPSLSNGRVTAEHIAQAHADAHKPSEPT